MSFQLIDHVRAKVIGEYSTKDMAERGLRHLVNDEDRSYEIKEVKTSKKKSNAKTKTTETAKD